MRIALRHGLGKIVGKKPIGFVSEASVVQWIEYAPPKGVIAVRLCTEAHN